ncbi:MAG: hypothetical protein JOZ77_08035 [Candidatus Eremiobacteraeota bacterium]|nr:hypothetical protein [Candidatus Eremiobacteraeota bacterium]
MTIGINPNLTAFAPGTLGASWCYPKFTPTGSTKAVRRTAYYYRYRSVTQERLALGVIERFVQAAGRVTAEGNGTVVSAVRTDDAPSYTLIVRYAHRTKPTSIELRSKAGQLPYAVFVDVAPPHNTFVKGQLLAGRVQIPPGKALEVYAQEISYYTRFRTALSSLQNHLRAKGHPRANLAIGEDVGQLDMVACASPHWGPGWLGGDHNSVLQIMHACVSKNAWALKQLLHSKPALLLLVGQASYDMFAYAFGHCLSRSPALPEKPQDGAFTLLELTSDDAHPTKFSYNSTVGGVRYSIDTRVVVVPHFSYAFNYAPQYRLPTDQWNLFVRRYPECAEFLETSNAVQRVPPATPNNFVGIALMSDVQTIRQQLRARWPAAADKLERAFCDPNATLGALLCRLYDTGVITWVRGAGNGGGYLARAAGPCTFCEHFAFAEGCPYGKPAEPQYPSGFLTTVAQRLVAAGKNWRASNGALAKRSITDSPFRGLVDPTV